MKLQILFIVLYTFSAANADRNDEIKLIYHTCDPKDQQRLNNLKFNDLNSVYITKLGQLERFYPVKAKNDTDPKRYITLCNDDNKYSANKLRVCYSNGKTSSAEFEVDLWNMAKNSGFKKLPSARLNHDATSVFHICMPGGWGTILIVDCSYTESIPEVKTADDFQTTDFNEAPEEMYQPNRRLVYFHIGFGATIILNAIILAIMSLLVSSKLKVEKDKSGKVTTPTSKSVDVSPAKKTEA